MRVSSRVWKISTAAMEPRAPSKFPPPGTESICEPIRFGFSPLTRPGRVATMFPAGSGREGAPETRAKPEVWTKRAEFDAAVADMVKETAALGDAAKAGNADAVKAAWPKVAEACGACHGGPNKSGGKFRFEE